MISKELRDIFAQAVTYAKGSKHEYLTIEHIFLMLLNDEFIENLLSELGLDTNKIFMDTKKHVDESTPKLPKDVSDDPIETVTLTSAIEHMVAHTQGSGKGNATIDDMFVAILKEEKSYASYLLKTQGIERVDILEEISHKEETEEQEENKKQSDVLSKNSTELVELAKKGEIDPVIGREMEIKRVVQVLSRRKKNNPLLVGEPGVGKTAIAEALALEIAHEKVPYTLQNAKLFSLDMGSLLAGTKYRGDFEKKLKALLKEISDIPNAILFIDEIHTIIGAGASEGSMDAANILKPALARGELHTIGATTLKEYRKYFEKDTAMQRRFQPVNVDEPSVNEALQMLRGIKEKLESHHNVIINDSALVASAKLSHRYIADRFLPDKAIDLIDEAAAELKMQIESEPQALSKIKRSIQTLNVEKEALKMEKSKKNGLRIQEIEKELADANEERLALESRFENEKQTFHAASNLKAKIEELKSKAERAKRESKFEEAASIEYGEIPELEKQIEQNEQKWERMQEEGTLLRNSVDEDSIASIVSRWTGIPVNKMLSSEKQRVLQVESVLKQDVIGQDEALKAISRAIKRNKAGLSQESRPIGSFMFLGPTGVGKTESAKTLAKFLFDDQKALIRFDMSEYMEKFAVSRLVGAPPGYVGYEEGGQLTEKVRRKPYSVVLLDEIEKAHPDVFNILLQLLDDGQLTDSLGRRVDFKNSIIIMTSNIGSRELKDFGKGIGFQTGGNDSNEYANSIIQKALKKAFAPEFLNRIDDLIMFNSLTQKDIHKIIDIELNGLYKRINDLGYNIKISTAAKDFIAEKGYDVQFGARPLKRAIQKYLEDEMAEVIIKASISEGDTISVGLDKTKQKITTKILKAQKALE
jgi:ATP-dependent Clp protease ATP-binding subunit ClpB